MIGLTQKIDVLVNKDLDLISCAMFILKLWDKHNNDLKRHHNVSHAKCLRRIMILLGLSAEQRHLNETESRSITSLIH